MKNIKIFCACDEKDRNFFDDIKKHLMVLTRKFKIDLYSNLDIAPGKNVQIEIDNYLISCQIIILMISVDFLNSDIYNNTLSKLASNHKDVGITFIPVILRDVAGAGIEQFSKLQVLPKNKISIIDHQNNDRFFASIIDEISRVCEEITRNFFIDKASYYQPMPIDFFRVRAIGIRLIITIILSSVMTGTITFVRYQGWLQNWELKSFDFLMRQKKVIPKDNNIVIIGVTEDDKPPIKNDPCRGACSLSQRDLNKLIQILNKENNRPEIIGLNIFLQGPIDPEYEYLRSAILDGQIITSCVIPFDKYIEGIKSPDISPSESTGFVNVFPDEEDDTIRRHLLLTSANYSNHCNKRVKIPSFSFNLASHFLEIEGFTRIDTDNDDSIIFRSSDSGTLSEISPFNWRSGGYYSDRLQRSFRSSQIVINYRAYEIYSDIAPVIPFKNIIEDTNSENLKITHPLSTQGKIVLIGRIDNEKDKYKVPFSVNRQTRLPSIMVHAQIISQIIDHVKKKRSIIIGWNPVLDFIWIWIWSISGNLLFIIINICLKRKDNLFLINLMLGLFERLLIFFLSAYFCFLLCLFCLTQFGLWVPLFPSLIAIGFSLLINYNSVTLALDRDHREKII